MSNLFNFTMRVGAPCQVLLFKDAKSPQGLKCSPLLKNILGDRHIRSLAKKPFHVLEGALDSIAGPSKLLVAFYPGCLGDKMYTDVSKACLKVLHVVGFQPWHLVMLMD